MGFVPSRPMTLAEHHVDWDAHQGHILAQRLRVERAGDTAARRLAGQIVVLRGAQPKQAVDRLAAQLDRALNDTLRFGYDEARREIMAQRATVAFSIVDAGEYAYAARYGLASARDLLIRRAERAAQTVAVAAAKAVATGTGLDVARLPGADPATVLLLAVQAARRALHNVVLELIGETLNMGRAAGALSLDKPPVYALRSEQLDKNTCEVCDHLHGEILQVGSPEFFAEMPPTGCLGGGRCRGIYVFGDSRERVEQPLAA